jgi:hypothetical protein
MMAQKSQKKKTAAVVPVGRDEDPGLSLEAATKLVEATTTPTAPQKPVGDVSPEAATEAQGPPEAIATAPQKPAGNTQTLVIDYDVKKLIIRLLEQGRTVRNVTFTAKHQFPEKSDQIDAFFSAG